MFSCSPHITANTSPVSNGLPDGVGQVLAGFGLILAAPLFLWIIWQIRREGGGPVFFRQTRVGFGGKPFSCLKFRSMFPDAEARLAELLSENSALAQEYREKHKLAQDPRVTPFGRFLRQSSLDELPQLLNVLKGDMALVGPRPLEPKEVAAYGDLFPAYCQTRPGLTGLWQVSGRSDRSFQERVDLDRQYLESRSPRRDLKLLWKTLFVVLSRQGAY